LVRAFITEHYKLATAGTQTIVPWNQITTSPSIFIDAKYLPELREAFNEPSRMRWTDADSCLNHWRGRQLEGDASKTFRFKRIVVKKEVVHPRYDGAALIIQGRKQRVGTLTPIPNQESLPRPIAPLPRTRNVRSNTKRVSTEPEDSEDNLESRVVTSPIAPATALDTPPRGRKRPASDISAD
jgi:hypothetical protein